MSSRGDGSGSPGTGRGRRDQPVLSRRTRNLLVVVVLLLAVSALRLVLDQPSLAVSLYALVPIVLAAFWFGLVGGVLAAVAATLAFLVDELLTPSPELAGGMLGLATFNRAVVFIGIAVLVSGLLRRERELVGQVREQQEQLAELESLRAVLTPSTVPPRPDLDIATSFTPAEGLVAGDFFLVVEGPADSTTIVVGDVVGHGLEAARCAAFVRAALSTFARFSRDPVQLLQLANAALAERRLAGTEFVTAVCLNIGPPPCRTVDWAAAGHETPWRLDTGSELPGGRVGLPLGLGPDALEIEAGHLTLDEAAGLLAFTDGLTEARSSRRTAPTVAVYGDDRARRIVRENHGESPAQVLAALTSSVAEFAGGRLADDLCLVAVRTTPVAATCPP